MKVKWLVLSCSFVLLVVACTAGPTSPTPSVSPTQTDPPTPVPSPDVDPNDPFEVNRRLGRGLNLGNALEAPQEGEWGVVLQEGYFPIIRNGGFDAVRVPTRWSAHAADSAPYTIDPAFFERIDWVVDNALERDLLVVLNMHHYDEIFEDPEGHRERFLAMWGQIAEHYQDYPPELIFEILNEPHGALTSTVWNALLVDALTIIRETNPDRNVIVGPGEWNSVNSLGSLRLPQEDRHIIVTFHYYEPFRFTHQGAEWVGGSGAWLGTTWKGTPAEQRAVVNNFDFAASWAESQGRPLYVGEFGAYSKADDESRGLWTAFVARQAEARGMSWAYWEFCAGFGVFDRQRAEWREPLYEALIPPEE